MILFESPMVCLSLAVIAVLHLLSVILPGVISKTISYVNIILHIFMLLLLIKYEFTIEDAVLVYMISVFVFTFFAFIKGKRIANFEKKAARLEKEFFDRKNSESGRDSV